MVAGAEGDTAKADGVAERSIFGPTDPSNLERYSKEFEPVQARSLGFQDKLMRVVHYGSE